jgi:hypothetical protein
MSVGQMPVGQISVGQMSGYRSVIKYLISHMFCRSSVIGLKDVELC